LYHCPLTCPAWALLSVSNILGFRIILFFGAVAGIALPPRPVAHIPRPIARRARNALPRSCGLIVAALGLAIGRRRNLPFPLVKIEGGIEFGLTRHKLREA